MTSKIRKKEQNDYLDQKDQKTSMIKNPERPEARSINTRITYRKTTIYNTRKTERQERRRVNNTKKNRNTLIKRPKKS